MKSFSFALVMALLAVSAHAQTTRSTHELVADLDLDRYHILPPGDYPTEMHRDSLRFELETQGQRTHLTTADDNDVFKVIYYDDRGREEVLGRFYRGSLKQLIPALRNAQAVGTVAGQVAAFATGAQMGVGASMMNSQGYAATSLGVVYGGQVSNVAGQGVKAVAPERGMIARGASGVSNTMNPAWATGRATVERVLKVELLEKRAVYNSGGALVLIGAKGWNLFGWQVTADDDAARDIRSKVIDLIDDLNKDD